MAKPWALYLRSHSTSNFRLMYLHFTLHKQGQMCVKRIMAQPVKAEELRGLFAWRATPWRVYLAGEGRAADGGGKTWREGRRRRGM